MRFYLLKDNGAQFASKFYGAVCPFLGVKLCFTTAYHRRENGKVERFNKTIVHSLRHYVAENQKDWDRLVFLFFILMAEL